jgi:hypothetical protein
MPQQQIRCSDCAAKKEEIERSGRDRVTSCDPVADRKGWCLITYVPAAAALGVRPIRDVKGVGGVRGKMELSSARGVARRLFDLETAPSRAAPRRIAESLLRRLARQLKIAPDLSKVKFDGVKWTLLGRHVLFQQYHLGKPISGAWIRVDLDAEGRVFNVQNDLIPEELIAEGERDARRRKEPAAKPLTKAQALAKAFEAAPIRRGGQREVLHAELMYGTSQSKPRLAWKIVVHTDKPRAEWKLYLDAYTGDVVTRRNVLKHSLARGRVFDPNPVAVLNDTSLTNASTLPDNAYVEVDLPAVATGGHLDGRYVSTVLTKSRVRAKNGKFLYGRGKKGFKEVMVYFHIDRAQRYLQLLGFSGIVDFAIKVNVAGSTEDNSAYSPGAKTLSFGTGGVDDAEDAEIILHEYGHAIQDSQVPGWGDSDESAGMGEGFGDYFAASFFAEQKPLAMRPTVGNWDAVAYSGDEPPALRRLDSNKKYPKDLSVDEHDNGEIWSACLWQLRMAVGRPVADKLVIAHHYLVNRRARFEDAANALLTTDRQLFGGVHAPTIRQVFVARGILPNAKRAQRRAGHRFDQP